MGFHFSEPVQLSLYIVGIMQKISECSFRVLRALQKDQSIPGYERLLTLNSCSAVSASSRPGTALRASSQLTPDPESADAARSCTATCRDTLVGRICSIYAGLAK